MENDLSSSSSSNSMEFKGQQPEALLSMQLVMHGVGYMGDISQANKYSNPDTKHFPRGLCEECGKKREGSERIPPAAFPNISVSIIDKKRG